MGRAAGRDAYLPFPLPSSPDDLGLRLYPVATDGGPISLYCSGNDHQRALVFIHGLNGSWQSWGPLLRVLADTDVTAESDVVVADFTGARLPRTLPALKRFAETMAVALAERRWTSASLVAHSTGGSLAAYMTSLPLGLVEIKELKLVSGLYVDLFAAARTPLWRTNLRDGVQSSLAKLKLLAAMGPLGAPLLDAAARFEGSRKLISSSLYARGEEVPAEVVAAQLASFDNKALADTLAIGKVYPPATVYRDISVPVREAIGDADPLIRPADGLAAAKLIRDFTWTTIAGAGHFAHIERPYATADFLFPLSRC